MKICACSSDFSRFLPERLKSLLRNFHLLSIVKIGDILDGNGVFKKLGEKWFDDFWMNYGKIQITLPDGKIKKITSLKDYLVYRGKDAKFANPMARKPSRKTNRRGQK